MNTKVDFSEWLAGQLTELGWSARELARRADISHSLISAVLSGREPSWDFCAAIAGPLEVSPIEVLVRAGKLTTSDIRRALPGLPEERVGFREQLIALMEELPEEEQRTLFRLLSRAAGQG